MQLKQPLHPSQSALLEVGVMCLPAIPAYLWAWPNLTGVALEAFQVLTYLYIIAGTLYIGRRRWSWDALGVNRRGLWLTLGYGGALLLARLLIILGVAWTVQPARLTAAGLLWELFFYIGLVGVGEELLFRGLVYRLLEDWPGARHAAPLAIWGSSIGFIFWHIFGQGPVVGLAALLVGLVFGLLRQRGGGILGLVILHGLWDLEAVLLVSESNAQIVDAMQVTFSNPLLVWVGTALLVLVPLFLWLAHPRLARKPDGRP